MDSLSTKLERLRRQAEKSIQGTDIELADPVDAPVIHKRKNTIASARGEVISSTPLWTVLYMYNTLMGEHCSNDIWCLELLLDWLAPIELPKEKVFTVRAPTQQELRYLSSKLETSKETIFACYVNDMLHIKETHL